LSVSLCAKKGEIRIKEVKLVLVNESGKQEESKEESSKGEREREGEKTESKIVAESGGEQLPLVLTVDNMINFIYLIEIDANYNNGSNNGQFVFTWARVRERIEGEGEREEDVTIETRIALPTTMKTVVDPKFEIEYKHCGVGTLGDFFPLSLSVSLSLYISRFRLKF